MHSIVLLDRHRQRPLAPVDDPRAQRLVGLDLGSRRGAASPYGRRCRAVAVAHQEAIALQPVEPFDRDRFERRRPRRSASTGSTRSPSRARPRRGSTAVDRSIDRISRACNPRSRCTASALDPRALGQAAPAVRLEDREMDQDVADAGSSATRKPKPRVTSNHLTVPAMRARRRPRRRRRRRLVAAAVRSSSGCGSHASLAPWDATLARFAAAANRSRAISQPISRRIRRSSPGGSATIRRASVEAVARAQHRRRSASRASAGRRARRANGPIRSPPRKGERRLDRALARSRARPPRASSSSIPRLRAAPRDPPRAQPAPRHRRRLAPRQRRGRRYSRARPSARPARAGSAGAPVPAALADLARADSRPAARASSRTARHSAAPAVRARRRRAAAAAFGGSARRMRHDCATLANRI